MTLGGRELQTAGVDGLTLTPIREDDGETTPGSVSSGRVPPSAWGSPGSAPESTGTSAAMHVPNTGAHGVSVEAPRVPDAASPLPPVLATNAKWAEPSAAAAVALDRSTGVAPAPASVSASTSSNPAPRAISPDVEQILEQYSGICCSGEYPTTTPNYLHEFITGTYSSS